MSAGDVLKRWDGTVSSDCDDKTCTVKIDFVVHVPASALPSEIGKRVYTYFAFNYTAEYPSVTQLGAGNPVVTASQKTAPDALHLGITLTYPGSNKESSSRTKACTKDSESADGVGLPGPHGCGAATAAAESYLG